MENGVLYRLSAFTSNPMGGNPAGVWVGDSFPSATAMQSIAAEVGYSETIFIAPRSGSHYEVRYFSPENEVPFCGHATIAGAILLAELYRYQELIFTTAIGEIPITVVTEPDKLTASLTSVHPTHEKIPDHLLLEVLSLLNWGIEDLDCSIPPARAFAGSSHYILAVKERERLIELGYDFEGLKTFMLKHDLTTLQLIWKESESTYHSRNPFPVGGVVEDPATGSAAAAFGGYLRGAKLIVPPAKINIHQGGEIGKPSLIMVEIPLLGGIIISGMAVHI
jgi:PhzF family phenazine biosynthesis protein